MKSGSATRYFCAARQYANAHCRHYVVLGNVHHATFQDRSNLKIVLTHQPTKWRDKKGDTSFCFREDERKESRPFYDLLCGQFLARLQGNQEIVARNLTCCKNLLDILSEPIKNVAERRIVRICASPMRFITPATMHDKAIRGEYDPSVLLLSVWIAATD